MGLQPVEDYGVTLPQRDGSGRADTLVTRIEGRLDGLLGRCGNIRGIGTARGHNLVSRNQPVVGRGYTLHVAQVGQRRGTVQLLEARIVEPRDHETVAPRPPLAVHEQHLDLVAHAEAQRRGRSARDKDILRALLAPNGGHLPRHKAAAPPLEITLTVHALYPEPRDLFAVLGHACGLGVGPRRSHTLTTAQLLQKGVATGHGLTRARAQHPHVADTHIGSEPPQITVDAVPEPRHHGQRHDHHGDAQRRRDGRYAHHDPRARGAAAAGRTFGQHVLKTHGASYFAITVQSYVKNSYFCLSEPHRDTAVGGFLCRSAPAKGSRPGPTPRRRRAQRPAQMFFSPLRPQPHTLRAEKCVM